MFEIYIDSKLEIHSASPDWIDWFKSISTFEIMDIGEVSLYEEGDGFIRLPRGLENSITSALTSRGISYRIFDRTYQGLPHGLQINKSVNYTSGDFYYQGDAADAILKHRTARLDAPTGSGKTIMSCIAMHKLGRGNALFLTMRDNLLSQFIGEACEVFDLPEEEIGIIKGKKFSIKPVTVASLPTIGSKGFLESKIDKLRDEFSIVIFDECHRSKAITYRDALMRLNPSKLYGVSATPDEIRDSEVLRMMEALLGPIVHRVTEAQIPGRITPEAYVRKTGRLFKFDTNANERQSHWQRVKFQKSVALDAVRNSIIVKDTIDILNSDPQNKVLICVCLVDHGKTIANLLKERGIDVCFPYVKAKDYSAMSTYKQYATDEQGSLIYNESGKRVPLKDSNGNNVYSKTIYKMKLDEASVDEATVKITRGQSRVFVGTYDGFTEGFNCKPLNTVIMAGPVSGNNSQRIYQLVGRCCRRGLGKTKVYALYYEDVGVPSNRLGEWAKGFSNYCIEKWGNCFTLNPPPSP